MSVNIGDTQPEGNHDKLTALLAAYREACPDPEPDANFMPTLWRKIEARQTFAVTIRRISRAFVTVAAAMCVLMAVVLVSVQSRRSVFNSGSYVEMLAAEQAPEGMDLIEASHLDSPGENN